MKTNFSEFFSFDSCEFIFFYFHLDYFFLHRYFSMVGKSILQLYRRTIAYRTTAASRQLINECNQEIRQVENQITSNSRAKNKVTKPVK